MAKLTSDLQDLRKKDVKALESLVLEIRENQFKNRMKHKTGQLTESHLLTVDRKKIAQIKTVFQGFELLFFPRSIFCSITVSSLPNF